MIIKKKTWPTYFEQILQGKKTFDMRLADFEAKEGDALILEEYDPGKKEYTGRRITKKVGYVLKFKVDQYPFHSKEKIEEKGLQIISLQTDYNDGIEVILRAIIVHKNKILLNHSPENPPAYYYLPGGHLEKGETLKQSLARELKEEIGVRIKKMKLLDTQENFYADHFGDHHEINLLYEVILDLKNSDLVKSRERDIYVTWLDINKLSAIKLLPTEAHKFLFGYCEQSSK